MVHNTPTSEPATAVPLDAALPGDIPPLNHTPAPGSRRSRLESIPLETLEMVAFYAATPTVASPPKHTPLLLTSRTLYALLNPTANPHLYARIFAAKFDVECIGRRIGGFWADDVARWDASARNGNKGWMAGIPAWAFADELKRRFTALRAFKQFAGALLPTVLLPAQLGAPLGSPVSRPVVAVGDAARTAPGTAGPFGPVPSSAAPSTSYAAMSTIPVPPHPSMGNTLPSPAPVPAEGPVTVTFAIPTIANTPSTSTAAYSAASPSSASSTAPSPRNSAIPLPPAGLPPLQSLSVHMPTMPSPAETERHLWVAYLLLLESSHAEGNKNHTQLRRYARIHDWLSAFLFHKRGNSRIVQWLENARWPKIGVSGVLAIWCFWFLLEPETGLADDGDLRHILSVLKLLALTAHRYPLCYPAWMAFDVDDPTAEWTKKIIELPSPATVPLSEHSPNSASAVEAGPKDADGNPLPMIFVNHYGRTLPLLPPPCGAPAILSYLTLANQLPLAPGNGTMVMNEALRPSVNSAGGRAAERVGAGGAKEGGGAMEEADWDAAELMGVGSWRWEAEWGRCVALGRWETTRMKLGLYDGSALAGVALTRPKVFVPGMLSDVWEGNFTYTEFTAHANLLEGGPPGVLQRSLVAQHRQNWRLREYYLVAPVESPADSPTATTVPVALDEGPPRQAHLPTGTHLIDQPDNSLLITRATSPSGRPFRQFYRPWASLRAEERDPRRYRIVDVIIKGEGHSSWGQFFLMGRVRLLDGLVSLAKDYEDQERGSWLYRGYLVGSGQESTVVGRWRDTITPPEQDGYEGGFVMYRRGVPNIA